MRRVTGRPGYAGRRIFGCRGFAGWQSTAARQEEPRGEPVRPGVPAPSHQRATGAQAQKRGSLAGRESEPPHRLSWHVRLRHGLYAWLRYRLHVWLHVWLFFGRQVVARWRTLRQRSILLSGNWHTTEPSSSGASAAPSSPSSAFRSRCRGSQRCRRCSRLYGDGILRFGCGGSLPGSTTSATIVGRAVGSGHDAATVCSVYWWRLDAAATAGTANSTIPEPGPAAELGAAVALSAADRVFPRTARSQVIYACIHIYIYARLIYICMYVSIR